MTTITPTQIQTYYAADIDGDDSYTILHTKDLTTNSDWITVFRGGVELRRETDKALFDKIEKRIKRILSSLN